LKCILKGSVQIHHVRVKVWCTGQCSVVCA